MNQSSGLREHLDALPTDWADILRRRYGFDGYRMESTEEIAGRFGKTKLWIRQIEKAALTMIYFLEQGYSPDEALGGVEAVMVDDSDE